MAFEELLRQRRIHPHRATPDEIVGLLTLAEGRDCGSHAAAYAGSGPRIEGAGRAIVISHDRWFLDRVATHILAFEGESKVTFFDGNFSEYEDWRKQQLGHAATRPHRITYRKLTR